MVDVSCHMDDYANMDDDGENDASLCHVGDDVACHVDDDMTHQVDDDVEWYMGNDMACHVGDDVHGTGYICKKTVSISLRPAALESTDAAGWRRREPNLSLFLRFDWRKTCSRFGGHFLGNEFNLYGFKALSSNGIGQSANSGANFLIRSMTTSINPETSDGQDTSLSTPEVVHPPRIKFKRLDKTARHIMNILDKEAVEQVRAKREIPAIEPGYIIQLKVEVPENKRRVSSLKGIVIATRNAGLNSTFRLRRLVAGVGVESVFPLYSPNIKEMKVLEKKKVRRAKLYYLRDRMNPLKK
ncbi:hypothetical protein J5N97_022979 [Dioscorea zingiberensis]|uniref:Ribosomal protein L19 n=1 Tax=Dioscorea zingiberensis TaxID=325984 RepID=A0A9D5CBG4_9LILI|nr:hypothetical protein J5N97_022979 [Dioscorea zingiberensis]